MDCLLGTHITQDIFNIAIGIIEKRSSGVNFTPLYVFVYKRTSLFVP